MRFIIMLLPASLFAVALAQSTAYPGHTLLTLNDGNVIPSPAFGIDAASVDQDATEIVTSALRVGYRHFEVTNPNYLVNLKEALEAEGIAREDLYVSAKFTRRRTQPTEVEFAETLSKLESTYLDLFSIDRPELIGDPGKVWGKMQKFQQQGEVRSLGVSFYDYASTTELLAARGVTVPPAVFEMVYDVVNVNQTRRLVEFAKEQGFLISSSIASAPLQGAITKQATAVLAGRRGAGTTTRQTNLAWFKAKGILAVVTGSTEANQIEDLAVFGPDFGTLTATDVEEFERAAQVAKLADEAAS